MEKKKNQTQRTSFLWPLVALLFFAPFCQAASPTVTEALQVRVGETYPLEGVSPDRVEATPSERVQVKRGPYGYVIRGLREGAANLLLWRGEQKITIPVTVRGVHSSVRSAPALFEKAMPPRLRSSKVGSVQVVQGECLTRREYQLALRWMKWLSGSKITWLIRTSPVIRESLVEQAHSALSRAGFDRLQVTTAGNRYFLEGSVESATQLERALTIASGVIPVVENHLPLPIRIDPAVTVRVQLLELSRGAHRALGLSWPSSVSQALQLDLQGAHFGPSWAANLIHLAQEGSAKVLAEPMLSVKSGSSAELTAGGEIPIRITGRYENKISWRHYGLKVNLHVAGISGGRIRTRIQTESSQLDEATSIDGIPGIRKTSLQTEIDALEGQPVLLTGLFQASAARDVEKIPLLGDIPILGELFRSRRFRDRESELLVALLPKLGLEPASIPLHTLHGLDFDTHWRLSN